jgi:hypothetical protein
VAEFLFLTFHNLRGGNEKSIITGRRMIDPRRKPRLRTIKGGAILFYSAQPQPSTALS